MAIRLSPRDRREADGVDGARAVLDHDRLTELRSERLGDGAGHHIAGGPRRGAGNDAYRPAWEHRLRAGEARGLKDQQHENEEAHRSSRAPLGGAGKMHRHAL